MDSIVTSLWLVPALPLAAAGCLALIDDRRRSLAAGVSIGAMALSLVLACQALLACLRVRAAGDDGIVGRAAANFDWLPLGGPSLPLGWVLDPLAASMAVMVCFVGLLIFIYSIGYMAADPRFKQFFCFLSLFAAAMLGLVIANSLLLLFMCWEVVGLASYLLIGFWHQKPEAAQAAKKAFITTRIGDLGFLVGMLWLYAETGTLLFYDDGAGCLESSALATMVATTTVGGMMVSTAIGLLIFCGAIGKSGQLPLHVWLPDAMEGPTPVSALIHAATMVAAGVFLVARTYPIFAVMPGGEMGHTVALTVVTWVGALTAVFAALIAVAQNDLKRILAYSTVSQLGYMMMGLGMGGVAVGMFHLLAHAFFKALLFLGAGSVILGCHHQQDIRRMGGLRRSMPVTFATYAVGMLALAGVFPLIGFWSKDEILLSGWAKPGLLAAKVPLVLGLLGAVLTAFYMTRQMVLVFFGGSRLGDGDSATAPVHESPRVMTVPLMILAGVTVLGGLAGPWVWSGFSHFVEGAHIEVAAWQKWVVMSLSLALALAGLLAGWTVYRRVADAATTPAGVLEEPLAHRFPSAFRRLGDRFYVDELYQATVIRWTGAGGRVAEWLERRVWEPLNAGIGRVGRGFGAWSRRMDERAVNASFDAGCDSLRAGGRWSTEWQNGRVQHYLRTASLAATILILLLSWGCGA